MTPAPERLGQVDDALTGVRARIARAAHDAGRDPAGITLVAVTKTFPVTDVVALAGLGVADVGENKDQEARGKVAELDRLPVASGLRWHLVGQLQSNKANSVTRYATAVHSVDRVKLVGALDRGVAQAREAGARATPLQVFLQVSLDGDPARGGAVAAGLAALADAAGAADHLDLAGVIAVAPVGWEPERAFADLAAVSADLRRAHPGAASISAGMSGDFETAIALGSTHVRVGSALLGSRPPVLG